MNQGINRTKFLMSYDNKTTLNENVQKFDTNNSSVITDWLSPDEKYIIFLDELYDVENQKKLGNIWENFDNFKIFLRHSFSVARNIPHPIKESLLDTLDNQLLTESRTNYTILKPIFKQILSERTWSEWGSETLSDWGNWMYEKGKEAYQGVSDFVSTTYEGAKKLIGNISRGEWNEVLNLLGSGVKYVARRLRDALYHPIGIILDAILVATGIGKAVQWIPWAIVVALDIYELVNNDFEDDLPYWMRYLFLGLDILGLVTAGGVSAALRTVIGGVKTEAGVVKAVGRETLQSIATSAGKAPGMLTKAAEWLAKKFPSGSTFIKGILGFAERMITNLVNVIKKLLSPKSLAVGTGTSGLVYGFEKGVEKLFPHSPESEPKNDFADSDIDDLMAGEAEYTPVNGDANYSDDNDLMAGEAEYTPI